MKLSQTQTRNLSHGMPGRKQKVIHIDKSLHFERQIKFLENAKIKKSLSIENLKTDILKIEEEQTRIKFLIKEHEAKNSKTRKTA